MTTDVEYVRIHLEVLKSERIATGPNALVKLVQNLGLHTQTQEAMWVIAFGKNGHLHRVVEVARGKHDEVAVDIASTLTAVLAAGAPRFALAHNHPTMQALPSLSDIHQTNHFMEAANTVGLLFEDHVIVEPKGDFYSFATAGKIVIPDTFSRKAASRNTR